MVYDCFPFFNEVDILKLRLNILNDYVDRFVIEEATVTFSGEPKALIFAANQELFREFLPKIDYIVVDDPLPGAATHERDYFQKNHLIRGLTNLSDEDIIMLSDVDEIPNPAVLRQIIEDFDPGVIYHLAQRMFYCYVNAEEISGKLLSVSGEFAGTRHRQWLGTKIFSVKNIPENGIIYIREADVTKAESVRVADGGWHFGYMGGKGEKDVAKRIGVKVRAAAHQEYNHQDMLAEAADKLMLGQDIFGRAAEFVRVELDESFPEYLREHQEEYAHLIMPPVGKGKAGMAKIRLGPARFARKAVQKCGRIYTGVTAAITMTHMAILTLIGFIVSLLPIIYLTLYNRASGDDYGYGTYTRAAWLATHSLPEVLAAAGRTVEQYYHGWQGTWFSVFLFTLQPEVFHPGAYVGVTAVTLILWIGAVTAVLYRLLVTEAGLKRSGFIVINAGFLLINMQFIPGTKSSLFWYNGIIHYLLPYAMCMLIVYCLAGYVRTFKWRYYGGIIVLLGFLGGSSYQMALFGLIVTGLFMLTAVWRTHKIKYFSLLLPLSIEMLGLIISMTAPGNIIRGGEDFGFSIGRIAETIIFSFGRGLGQAGRYLNEKPVAIIGMMVLSVVVCYAQSQAGSGRNLYRRRYPYPGLFTVMAFGLYCAMQAPELYAQTAVSQGVANINYQVFLLMILAAGVYWSGWLKVKGWLKPLNFSYLVLPAVAVGLLLTVIFRSDIKEMTAWKCLTYITSGQAADYRDQMELQTAVMLDSAVEEAVIPFINDIQGPLMHMPATDNPAAWTNGVMADFYGKKSVTAMDRTEWNRRYGAAGQ